MKIKIQLQLLVLFVCSNLSAQKTFTYPDLVYRLVDMEYLAQPPLEGEVSGNFSSYDRRAKYDNENGMYQKWDANGDGGGFLRKEDEAIVAFEADGPGVIWRVWSAFPKYGHIKIYIDHQETPIVDRPFLEYFTEFIDKNTWKDGGRNTRNNFPTLTHKISRGWNSWIPIAYNEHCKIVLEKGWGAYYHVTYTKFPENTILPKMKNYFEDEDCVALAEVDRFLYLRGRTQALKKDENKKTYEITVPAKSSINICEFNTELAITNMVVKPDIGEEDDVKNMLRELSMTIYWDGEKAPSVWSPLGDFFGTAPGINPYNGLPLGMSETSFYSRWFMPFEKAKLELTNDGNSSRKVTFQITTEPLQKSADEYLRFHAKFHKGQFKEQVNSKGRDIDWPLLVTKGEGRFCGVTFTVLNTWEKSEHCYKTNRWWGEGDEKFYVDGEKMPSTFGTGSEDYFGHAWAAPPPFPMYDAPFASQPFIEIDANGYTSLNRFHVADNIPFRKSFEASIEKYKENGGKAVHSEFDCVAYWYLKAGQKDEYKKLKPNKILR